jgi:hypothetical protein
MIDRNVPAMLSTWQASLLTVWLHVASNGAEQEGLMAAPSPPLAPAPGRMNVDFEERVDRVQAGRARE